MEDNKEKNPYPYPLQKPNKKGWIRALIALIAVAFVVTIICLVVGVYNHHERDIDKDTPVENVVEIP